MDAIPSMRVFDLSRTPIAGPHMPLAPCCMWHGPGRQIGQRGHGPRPSDHLELCTSVLFGGPGTGADPAYAHCPLPPWEDGHFLNILDKPVEPLGLLVPIRSLPQQITLLPTLPTHPSLQPRHGPYVGATSVGGGESVWDTSGLTSWLCHLPAEFALARDFTSQT